MLTDIQINAAKPHAKPSPHWYFVTFSECPVCGKGDTCRERRYGKRPVRLEERYSFQQFACVWHFL